MYEGYKDKKARKDYNREYMREYRETMRKLKAADQKTFNFYLTVYFRHEIIELIREKYNPTDKILHTLVDDLYAMMKEKFPYFTEQEREFFVDFHMLAYYRRGYLDEIFKRVEGVVLYIPRCAYFFEQVEKDLEKEVEK